MEVELQKETEFGTLGKGDCHKLGTVSGTQSNKLGFKG